MKDISNVVNNLNITKQEDHTLQNKVPPIVKSIVDSLFDQLAFVFPAWKYTWDTEEKIKGAKKEWVKAFFENDIVTKEQIAHGLKKARKMDSDFLPSCGKFVSWCNPSPEDLGYPDEQRALRDCISYRNAKKMGVNPTERPWLTELCSRVDWWLMNSASNQVEHKKADAHFKSVYIDFVNSDYREPEETPHERLETANIVVERMSPEQLESRKNRGLDAVKAMRANLAKAKLNNLSK